MTNILIVDDNVDFCENVKEYMEYSMQCNIDIANSGKELIDKVQAQNYDIITLDIQMPGENGIDLLPVVKKYYSGPIIMISCLTDANHKIDGLRNGADDYLTKPVVMEELRIRMEKLVKLINNDRLLEIGECCIDELNKIVYINDRKLNLNSAAYETFVLIVKNQGKVISREKLCNVVWEMDLMDSRVVDNAIAKIRKEAPEMDIKTIRGIGYIYE